MQHMVYEEKPRKVGVRFFVCLLVLFVCFSPSLKKRQGRFYCYYLNWDVVEAVEDGHQVRLSSEMHGERKMGKNHLMQHRKFPLAIKTKVFHHKGGQTPVEGPRELKTLHPWRCSKFNWMRSLTPCLNFKVALTSN